MSPVRIVGGIAISNWDLLRRLHRRNHWAASCTCSCGSTKEGQFLIAVSDNAKLAELYGISAKRAYRVTAAIAGLLICAGDVPDGLARRRNAELVVRVGPGATIATLLGGMGRIFMGALAAVILALIQSFSVLVISSRWQNLLLYGFLFVDHHLVPAWHLNSALRPKPRIPAPANVGVGQPADVTQRT